MSASTGLAFIVLLKDPDDAVGLARLLEDVQLPERQTQTVFVAPPIQGTAFFDWGGDDAESWRREHVPVQASLVYLVEHDPSLEQIIADVTGTFYIGVPDPDLAVNYGTNTLTFLATSPLDFATVIMRDFSRADHPFGDIFDEGDALRMAALSADFPINLESDYELPPPVDSVMLGGESFYGRTVEQHRFRELLQDLLQTPADARAAPTFSSVLLVYGVGGIGKTTLCARFRDIALHEAPFSDNVLVLSLDWETHESAIPAGETRYETLLGYLAEQLEWKGLARSVAPFRHLVDQMAKARERVDEQLRKESNEFSPLAKLGVGGLQALVKATVPVPALADLLNVGVGQLPTLMTLAKAWSSSHLRPGDLQLLSEGDRLLGRALADAFRAASHSRALVFLLDTYEIVAWAETLRVVYELSGPRVGWVVSGRFTDDQRAAFATRWPSERLDQMNVGQFNEHEVAAFLSAQAPERAPNTEELAAIVTATSGIPLGVSLAAGLWSRGASLAVITGIDDSTDLIVEDAYIDIIEALADRFLKYAQNSADQSEDYERLVGLALLPNRQDTFDVLDSELLAALWGIQRVGTALEALEQRYEFVVPRRMRLHDLVRDTLRRRLVNPAARLDLRASNKRAVELLEGKLGERQVYLPTLESRVADAQWRRIIAYLTWHRFWDSDESGWATLLAIFPAVALYDPILPHQLLDTARPLAVGWSEGGPDRTRLERLSQALVTSIQSLGGDTSWLDERVLHVTGIQPDAGCQSEVKAVTELWRGAAAIRSGLPEVALHHMSATAEQVLAAEEVAWPALRSRLNQELEQLIISVMWPNGRWSGVASPVGVEAARLLVTVSPGRSLSQYYLGNALFEARATRDQGIEALTEAARLDPKDDEIGLLLASAEFASGSLREATRRLEELIAADTPSNAWSSLGYMCLRRGDAQRAIGYLETAAIRNPIPVTLTNLGRAYQLADPNDKRAEEAFRRAVSLDPELPNPLVALASELRRQEKCDEAVTASREAVRLAAGTIRCLCHLQLATLLWSCGLTLESKREFDQAWGLWPELWERPGVRIDADLLEIKAIILLGRDCSEAALDELDEAVQALPPDFLLWGVISMQYSALDSGPPLKGFAEFRARAQSARGSAMGR